MKRKTKLNPLPSNWHETIVDLHCEEVLETAERHGLALPRFDDCIIDQATRLGCGEYGCAFECGDNCVVKLTLDSTEAHFIASMLARKRQEPGVIHFKAIYAIPERYEGYPVFICWREKAISVGIPEQNGYFRFIQTLEKHWKISDTVFEIAFNALGEMGSTEYWKWLNAELAVVKQLTSGKHAKTESQFANLLYAAWQMAGSIETSGEHGKYVGQALRSLMSQGLMLCDVHTNNVGVVERDGCRRFVISDVGHELVLSRDLQKIDIPIIGQ
jgi:hypothetical protein